MAFAVTAIAALPGSNFEIDTNANLVVDGPAPAIDWASVNEARKPDLPSGSGDNSFGNGTKEDTPVPSVVDGSIPPNKSDLTTFGVYLETNSAGARFLNLFWHRVQDPSGTTNMDFELNQSSTLSANGVTPVRTAGDLLIQYDLSQGGVNPVLFVSRWVTSGASSLCQAGSTPCWGVKQNLNASGDAVGSINTSSIPAAQADGLGAISARTFGEAQIDFDALTGGTGTCTSFGSAYLKSRSSDSFTAALKDFIAPTAVNLNNCATVRIRKETIPEENPNSTNFGFSKTFTAGTSANTFTLQDDGLQEYTNVVQGSNLVVDEDVVPAGWTLTGIDCNVAGRPSSGVTPNINVLNGTVTFSIDSAADVLDCTYTNTKEAKVTIIKDAVPNDAQDFAYTGSFGGFSLDDDSDGTLPNSTQFTVSPANLGSKTVTEAAQAGWSLTALTCTGDDNSSTSLGTRTATLDVDAGENITCTFENTKDAKVTIVKDAVPNDAQDFAYTGSFGGFSLDDDSDGTLPNSTQFTVPAAQLGSKTVTEAAQAGWALTGLSCTGDDNSSTSLGTRTATLDVDAGENITCTFENTKGASVTIVKDAVPNDAQDFAYTGSFGGFSLDDDSDGTLPNSTTFMVPVAQLGTKTVTETAQPGWSLTGLSCVGDDNPQTSLGTRTATLDVDAGENITCTFENTKDATITIVKDAIPDDAQVFGYQTDGFFTTQFDLVDDGIAGPPLNTQVLTVSGTDFGTKEVSEDEVSGWTLTDIVCTGDAGSDTDVATRTATLDVDPGETIQCTFTNQKDATVRIVKDAVPNDAQDFSFTSMGEGLSNFSLDDDSDPGLSNQEEFTISYPDFGPKSVTEGAVFGWDLTAVECTDTQGTNSTGDLDNRKALLNVDPGDSITCTFTNSQRASIIIRKQAKDASTDTAGLEPLGGVEFTITPNPHTGVPGSELVVTDKELDEGGEDAFDTTRGLICVDNVDPNVASFSVDETGAPTGYKQADAQDVTATIGSCAGRTTAATPDATFVNTPLSTFEVKFTSQATGENGGATAADIDCVDADNVAITPDSGTDDVNEVYSDREPNEVGEAYTCTIYVDP